MNEEIRIAYHFINWRPFNHMWMYNCVLLFALCSLVYWPRGLLTITKLNKSRVHTVCLHCICARSRLLICTYVCVAFVFGICVPVWIFVILFCMYFMVYARGMHRVCMRTRTCAFVWQRMEDQNRTKSKPNEDEKKKKKKEKSWCSSD